VTGTSVSMGREGMSFSEQTLILGEKPKSKVRSRQSRKCAGRYDGVIFAKGRVEFRKRCRARRSSIAMPVHRKSGGIFDGRCHMLGSSDARPALPFDSRNEPSLG